MCFECGKPGHYARDCWYRQDKGKADKGKGKGKTEKAGAVNELTAETGAGSVAASSLGASASAAGGHIRVITAQPYCEESELEGGYIFALINGGNEDDGKIMMLTDNCADEHVCGVDDFRWLPLFPSKNPCLSLPDGSPLAHYGMRRVPLQIAGNRTIIVEFQVTDVRKPILSIGKFCSRAPQRSAWYDAQGGVLRHESAGLVKVKRVANHYALECWAPRGERAKHAGAMLAPIVEAPEAPAARAAGDVLIDAEAEGAVAIPERASRRKRCMCAVSGGHRRQARRTSSGIGSRTHQHNHGVKFA